MKVHYEKITRLGVLRGVEDKPLNPANERLLECAEAAACEHHPDLDTLSERDRREIVVGFALRIHAVAKAVRELQEYGERGRVGHTGDPVRDVLAAELRDLHQLSWPEVGRQLGMSRTGRDEDKGGQQAVEVAAKRGRAMLDQALPEGWDEYVARCRRNLGL